MTKLLIAFVSLLAQAQVVRIAGVAVDATSGRPMKRVRVVLVSSRPSADEVASWMTTEDGKFAFDVAPGKYRLFGERKALPPQVYGVASLDNSFGISIIAGPDQQTDRLTFKLHPPASISGTVLDEAGEPVENALVQLSRVISLAGRRSVVTRGSMYTNDRGEYRFAGLAAGAYYLGVTGKPWYGSGLNGPAGRDISFAPVFFPNVATAKASTPLMVKAGQEATANFTLFLSAGSDINITIDPPASTRVRFQLVSEGPMGTQLYERVSTGIASNHRIPTVPRGSYELRVLKEPSLEWVAAQKVEVAAAGPVDISLRLKDPLTISGSVEFLGPTRSSSVTPRVWIHDHSYTGPSGNIVDGKFTIKGVRPGRYCVHVMGDNGTVAESLALEEKPLKDLQLEVGQEGVKNLVVVARTGGGKLKGIVRLDGKPLAGILVALAPSKATPNHMHYRGFRTDSDGSFEWDSIAPGDYRLFTIEDPEFEFSNPDVVRPLADKGKLVRIELNKTLELNVDFPVTQ